jgi:hypothetical protein
VKRIWLLLLLLAPCVGATTLQQLMDEDQLRLNSWLTPASDIVPGQEVQLTIEISTRRWFAGGTRIKLPEVPQLVVLQRDQFANNLSRREEGGTWVIQRWHLELYPQRAGEFEVPPINLELAVNDARAGIVQGKLVSKALAFSAVLPAALQGIGSWVAAPQFSLQQKLDPAPEQLQPGDAFTREVIFKASNLTAMMLPSLAGSSPQGLSAYKEISELVDRSNRGEAIAERTERIVYVVESAGQYQLPDQTFYWWDTANNQMEITILPAVTVDAGGGVLAPPPISGSPVTPEKRAHLDPLWLAPMLLLPLIYMLYRLRRSRAGQFDERLLLKQVEACLRSGERERAIEFLYQWLNQSRPLPDWYRLRRAVSDHADSATAGKVSALMDSVYGGAADANVGALKARQLSAKRSLPRFFRRCLPRPVKLELNPGPDARGSGSFSGQSED